MMSKISNINDGLLQDGTIASKKKAPVIYIALLITGIASVIATRHFSDSENLSFAFLFVGVVLTLIGVVGIFIPKKYLCYAPTGEKLNKKELFFSAAERECICNYLNAGEIEKIIGLPAGDTSALMVIIYSTPSKSFMIAQVQEYVPYQYVPVTEPVVLKSPVQLAA